MDSLSPGPTEDGRPIPIRCQDSVASALRTPAAAGRPSRPPLVVAPGETRILVVDKEPDVRAVLRTLLASEGFTVLEASDGSDALGFLRRQGADVVLAASSLPGVDGVTLVKSARQEGLAALFVMMTDSSGIEAAVEAMRAGAENFVIKPFEASTLLVVLEKVLEKRRLARETEQLRDRVRERYCLDAIIGESTALQAVCDVVKREAPTNAAMLLLGEPGTGKELVAQAIHQQAARRDAPFIKVSCTGLSEALLEAALFGSEGNSSESGVGAQEGSFERANHGTLFLDEIGELPPSLQGRVLSLLEHSDFKRVGGSKTVQVDVRVVAATNRDLAGLVSAGRFREDLFLRLGAVAVTLPPLRARKGDIPVLVSHFIEKFNQSHGKSVRGLMPGILNDLLRYDWPGNVRELENVVERAVVLARGQYLTPDELPPVLCRPGGANPSPGGIFPGATLRDIEREAILRTLEAVEGSTPLAAAMLGISPRKIQYRLKEYGGTNLHGGTSAPVRSRPRGRAAGGGAA